MTASPRYSLRWSAQAERDVDDIADRIARHDAVAARAWIDRVIRHVENVAAIPLAGRVVPDSHDPTCARPFSVVIASCTASSVASSAS